MKKKLIIFSTVITVLLLTTLIGILLKQNIIATVAKNNSLAAYEPASVPRKVIFSWQSDYNGMRYERWYIPWAIDDGTKNGIKNEVYCIRPNAWLSYVNSFTHQPANLEYTNNGIMNLPIAAAYIIATDNEGYSHTKWQNKQRAIWNLGPSVAGARNRNGLGDRYDYGTGENLIKGSDKSSNEGSSSFDTKVVKYVQYHQKMTGGGYTKEDKTDIKNLAVEKVGKSGKTYKAGNFKISYDDNTGGLGLNGFKSAKLKGLDSNKNYITDIPITAIKNKKGNKISKIPQNEEFYVEFDEPSSNISYVQLSIEFEYKLAFGEYYYLTGDTYDSSQDLMIPSASFRTETTSMDLEPVEVKKPTLSGNVWLDGLVQQGKENNADGKNDTANDIKLPYVKVTLKDSSGNIATLDADSTEPGLSEEDIRHKINPTYTDNEGNYKFEGVDSSKQYYVEFEYDGQMYLPTQKLNPEGDNTSKALEDKTGKDGRETFNNKFGEIRSYPENYKTSNSLGKNLGTYNKTYTQYELMGYVLDESGKYKKTGTQLIDGFTYDENGNQTKTYTLGTISTKIKDYINTNKQSPSTNTIYSAIAGNNTEMWRKLQYIEDCKMKAKTDKNIVPTKEHINLGLWRRQESKLILTKDVLYGATRINGKTELYEYNHRKPESNQWEIQTRMQNYAQYYGGAYVNGIYQTDYQYEGAKTNGGSDLEVYITYKISVKNASSNIITQIPEVVDYYDKNYEFKQNLSWVMYDNVNLKKEDYYNMIDTLTLSKIPNNKSINSQTSSRYGSSTHQNISGDMQAIYIKGLENKTLSVGEQAYIYLTFKLKENSNGIILDEYTNYAEINGYKTSYANGVSLPNNSPTGVAGIIDQRSTPGNLTSSDLQGNKHEKNFENDTDRAVGIKVELTKQDRKLNGFVWEDARTKEVSGAVIGDGIRQESEKKVAGVTVQLLEKLKDGKEYLWKTATTGKNGLYEFNGVIPGEYVIRFIYGNNPQTVVASYSGGTSYNGQDFKSTVYQKDMATGQELGEEIYNISKMEGYGKNLSDAKDLWENQQVTIKQANSQPDQKVTLQGRTTVNNYSTTLTNEKAEILASPYKTNATSEQLNTLVKNTQMVAQTAIITLEGEKNTKISMGKSNGVGNETPNSPNGNYVLNNIDFGLTERPKAQLELNKTVEHVKVVLANRNVLFDSKGATNNLIWKPREEYDISKLKDKKYYPYGYNEDILKILDRKDGKNNGIIQITMDEEIMHGATIQITYNISVKNSSETDYTGKDFYYKGKTTSESKLVTTTATKILDYISNNLQYRPELSPKDTWSIIKNAKDIKSPNLKDNVEKINVIVQTDKFALLALEPGQEALSKEAITVSQVITPENEKDDLTYENIAEIVEASNSVGRRLAFSIVGSQDPLEKAQEVTSSNSEQVIILPPFGEINLILYITLGIVAIAAIAGGIILIKKKVLK